MLRNCHCFAIQNEMGIGLALYCLGGLLQFDLDNPDYHHLGLDIDIQLYLGIISRNISKMPLKYVKTIN